MENERVWLSKVIWSKTLILESFKVIEKTIAELFSLSSISGKMKERF